jgi:hypothetical protein
MGQATAELYPAKISKGQRLVSGFRPLNRFLHDFAGARQFAVRQPQLPIRAKALPWLSKLSSSATPLKLDCFDEPLTRYAAVSYSQRGSGWVRFGL